jgi:hypothetical protein
VQVPAYRGSFWGVRSADERVETQLTAWDYSSVSAVPTRLVAYLMPCAVIAGACASSGAQRPVACTLVYGGEQRAVNVPPTADPYGVPLTPVSDALAWKIVYVAAPEELAVVSVYTYALAERGPVLIHQAKYRPPYPRDGAQGFTGLQSVYEPRYGHELNYWCGWAR